MFRASQAADDVVQGDAAAQHHPRGQRRIEAAGKQRDGLAFTTDRQTARSRQRLGVQERTSFAHLDIAAHLRILELHLAVGHQARPQLALDLGGMEGRWFCTACPHCEGPALQIRLEIRRRHVQQGVEIRRLDLIDLRDRMHPEDVRQHLGSARIVAVGEQAGMPGQQLATDAGGRQGILGIVHDHAREATPRARRLGGDVGTQADHESHAAPPRHRFYGTTACLGRWQCGPSARGPGWCILPASRRILGSRASAPGCFSM